MGFNGKNRFFIENMIRYLFLIHGFFESFYQNRILFYARSNSVRMMFSGNGARKHVVNTGICIKNL